MNKKELWVVSYSHNQKCFHCEQIDSYLEYTITDYFRGEARTTYNMIGIFDTWDQGQSYIKKLKAMREEKTNF